ncbi:MAG: GFA family protein [Gammaproteobacteria bacterium]|nr:GFA family protein [Gammaproteobacteria bacterium]
MCRRSHGAGAVTWVGVENSNFRITQGRERIVWFASSPPARRGFCSQCGTTFLFQSQRWPTEMHISRANFDGAIDREPSGHAYPDDHVPWLLIDGGPGSDGKRA